MTRRILRPALAALVLLFACSCAGSHVREGDKLVKAGKYEEALVSYHQAEKVQATNRVLKRIAKAEKKLVEVWIKNGLDAAKSGEMGEAADWWKRAAELRPNDSRTRVVIAENASKLEIAGERAMNAKKWEESFRCWEALRVAYPDRFDLTQKIDEAKKMFAADLDRDAQALAKKGLTGAALVLSMRALTYDPLQDGGFVRQNQYRNQLAIASLVNITVPAVDDRGHWAMGSYLVPALTRRLGEYPPYGPTKKPEAAQAMFAVTVEEFGWWDEVTYGYTKKEEAGKAASKEKQPSSERAAQKTIVEKLEKELKTMEALAARATPTPAPAPTPEPPKDKKGAKGKEPATAAAAAPVKRSLSARAPTAEEIAKKRAALEEALAKYLKLPELVDADIAATVWYLPWQEVTRVVEARVRFEVLEMDIGEPVTKTLTLRTTSQDRTHAGDPAHVVVPDSLVLRPVEDMVRDLAADFGGPGTETLLLARTRRADKLIERGREARAKGNEDEALDLYVRAIFAKGVEGGTLPGDVATAVAIRLENGSFRDIIGGP